MMEPLAQRLRPRTLDEVCGQRHLLAPGQVFRRTIDRGVIPNMIFYGPSGVGKTTVASIIAANSGMRLYKLNGTTASTSDIKSVLGDIGTLHAANGILLYLDEIQYFNKRQQQSLLECVEQGTVTLIASTTENPYFYVYNALLSRCTVFEFKQVPAAEVEKAVLRAVSILSARENVTADIEPGTAGYIASVCGGDVRKALNAVELLFSAAPREGDTIRLLRADAENITQRSAMHYDRAGDDHFDVVSALMKSLRGSDPDAALHYLARLLEAGDLIGACRRILCPASFAELRAMLRKAVTELEGPVAVRYPRGGSSVCRRRVCRWRRRYCCWRPRQSPTLSSCPSTPRLRTCAQGRRVPSRARCKTSTQTERASSVSKATNIRTVTRGTGCNSSICLMI